MAQRATVRKTNVESVITKQVEIYNFFLKEDQFYKTFQVKYYIKILIHFCQLHYLVNFIFQVYQKNSYSVVLSH